MPSSPGLLVDTNVLSELARPRPNRGVLTWAEGVTAVALSVVSLEEVFCGLAARPNARVRGWFEAFVESHCEVLPVTAEIARRCGQLRGGLTARGKARSQADMLIAATAQHHQLTLVTRNLRDFADLSLPLLNPFS